jgi:2-iminobutanoate/2-iminopropanoate deaminase
MSKETLSTDRAPAAVGPYSQAVRAGGLIFLSGQLPLDPDSGLLETGGIARQTEMVLTAVRNILEGAGSGLERVVKVTVFMTDLGGFTEMNEVFARFFPADPPARSAVEVAALPKGAGIEIDVIALAS